MEPKKESWKPFPKLREEADKLRSMTAKQAVQYLLEYYGVIFVCTVLALCAIISIASTIHKNRQKDPVLVCGVLDYYDAVSGNQIQEALTDVFPDAQGNQEPVVITFSSPDDETTMMGAS